MSTWKLLRELGLYADHYCDLSPHRIDASTMELHVIDCAHSLELSALKQSMKSNPKLWSFTQGAFEFLTEPLPKDFFHDLSTSDDRITSKKWHKHIINLKDWKVILPTPFNKLKHIAYYFAVPKKENVARAVWNGRTLSRSCRLPPPPVNLPFLPDLIRRIIQVMSQNPLGSPNIITADFSHFFYLIPISDDLSHYFGLAIEKIDENGNVVVDSEGKPKYQGYRFRVLVMGHSHSPWAAQSVGWAGILHTEKDDEELFIVPEGLKQLPTFIDIKDGGFICLFYDNIFAFGMNPDTMEKIKNRLARNFAPRVNNGGGFNFKYNYLDRHTAKTLRNPDTPAEYIGVEFSISTKRERELPPGTLLWRQCDKKHKKWMSTPPDWSLVLTPRYACSYIGKILWRHGITLRPLCGLAPVIRILRRIASLRQSTHCSWDDAVVQLSPEEQEIMAIHWDIVSMNKHEHGSTQDHVKAHRVRLVSDSSDNAYGYLIFSDDGKVKLEKGHVWSKSLNQTHIYIKELFAAVFAIRMVLKTYPKNLEINIGVDNTAAASSLRNMYSGNVMACEILDKLYLELQEHNASLRVWGLRSEENASDPSSRGKTAHPELVEECYRVMIAQERGHRINVPAQYNGTGNQNIRHPEYEEHDTPIDDLLFAEPPMTQQ